MHPIRRLRRPNPFKYRDLFTVDAAAGSVNSTPAIPGPGLRTVTDTSNRISVSSGQLILNGTHTGGHGNPGIWYPYITWLAGRCVHFRINMGSYSTNPFFGLDEDTATASNIRYWCQVADSYAYTGASYVRIHNSTYNAIYSFYIVMGKANVFFFTYGSTGDAPEANSHEPCLWWWHSLVPAAGYYPSVYALTGDQQLNEVSVFQASVPQPLASDSFTRADGAIGSTDSAGLSGEDSAGAAHTWTNRIGTFAISSNTAKPSAVDGGIAIATITPTANNVFLSAKLTRVTGQVGLVARYTDANNYIVAYHDGTNAKVDKVVAGVTTNLASAVKAYSAGTELRLWIAYDSVMLWYNNSLVTTTCSIEARDSAIRTGTMAGIYANNTDDSLTDFVCFATGHESQYMSLRAKTQRAPIIDFFAIGDSKTTLYSQYVPQMKTFTTDMREYPRRVAQSGGSFAQSAAAIDAELALYTDGNPTYCLINLGANDVAALPAEVDLKADMAYILAAVHTKWPNCQCYVMRPWRRGEAIDCNTLATWINDVVSTLDYAHLGPDERVFLEAGDDGVTYTSDGIHPNEAGAALTAAQWRSTLGIT